MSRKKLKITIECEGSDTQVIEANGIAAAILKDGEDGDHHGMQTVICGCMSVEDLIYLHDGVNEELTDAPNKAIIGNLSVADILEAMLGGRKRGSDR